MSFLDRKVHPWNRWRVTDRLASFLYVSGITGSGGVITWDKRGRIRWMPSLASLHYHRPYVLWKPDWWWECHRRQGLRIVGRHNPIHPFAFGICAACLPCPTCGEAYECRDDCAERGS